MLWLEFYRIMGEKIAPEDAFIAINVPEDTHLLCELHNIWPVNVAISIQISWQSCKFLTLN